MKKTFFTVGPSQLYPTVEKHMLQALDEQIGSLSHRGSAFAELFFQTTEALKDLLAIPKEYKIFFLSSATEGMERIVQNCVEKESFHFITGAFSKKFFEISQQHTKNAQKYEVELGKFQDYFSVKIPKSAEVIAITQNETNNGWTFLENDIAQIKKSHPKSLVAVDIVSSIPYVSLDFAKVDLAFFSVQKGFGLPAGLGVLVVSPQAYAKAESMKKKNTLVGSFHTFLSLDKYAREGQTPETPNVLGIYLLSKILADVKKKGLKSIRKEIDERAAKLYETLDISPTLRPLVTVPQHRSKTVIVAKGENLENLHKNLAKKNIVIGKGYGKFEDTQIRIGNFPAHTTSQIEQLVGILSQEYDS